VTYNRDRRAAHRGQVSRGGWEVVKTYGVIYEAIKRQAEPPTPEELDEVTGQLFAARNALLRIAPGYERR
jgi:hypothetical protein